MVSLMIDCQSSGDIVSAMSWIFVSSKIGKAGAGLVVVAPPPPVVLPVLPVPPLPGSPPGPAPLEPQPPSANSTGSNTHASLDPPPRDDRPMTPTS
jgi:hypothetical protein